MRHRLTQLDSVQLSRFHSRLVFDGVAVTVSVVLGYMGFIIVSVAEARRRIRIETEKAAIETELAAAREIQRIMVPEELPPTPGYAIESIYRPAAQVGGDFFQVIPLSGGQTLVVIGDVSGKGLSAAMIVSMLIGMLRTISGISTDPSQILAELNSMLFDAQALGFRYLPRSAPRSLGPRHSRQRRPPGALAKRQSRSHSPGPYHSASSRRPRRSKSSWRCAPAIASPFSPMA